MKGQCYDKVYEVHEQVTSGVPMYCIKDEDRCLKVIH